MFSFPVIPAFLGFVELPNGYKVILRVHFAELRCRPFLNVHVRVHRVIDADPVSITKLADRLVVGVPDIRMEL